MEYFSVFSFMYVLCLCVDVRNWCWAWLFVCVYCLSFCVCTEDRSWCQVPFSDTLYFLLIDWLDIEFQVVSCFHFPKEVGSRLPLYPTFKEVIGIWTQLFMLVWQTFYSKSSPVCRSNILSFMSSLNIWITSVV